MAHSISKDDYLEFLENHAPRNIIGGGKTADGANGADALLSNQLEMKGTTWPELFARQDIEQGGVVCYYSGLYEYYSHVNQRLHFLPTTFDFDNGYGIDGRAFFSLDESTRNKYLWAGGAFIADAYCTHTPNVRIHTTSTLSSVYHPHGFEYTSPYARRIHSVPDAYPFNMAGCALAVVTATRAIKRGEQLYVEKTAFSPNFDRVEAYRSASSLFLKDDAASTPASARSPARRALSFKQP